MEHIDTLLAREHPETYGISQVINAANMAVPAWIAWQNSFHAAMGEATSDESRDAAYRFIFWLCAEGVPWGEGNSDEFDQALQAVKEVCRNPLENTHIATARVKASEKVEIAMRVAVGKERQKALAVRLALITTGWLGYPGVDWPGHRITNYFRNAMGSFLDLVQESHPVETILPSAVPPSTMDLSERQAAAARFANKFLELLDEVKNGQDTLR